MTRPDIVLELSKIKYLLENIEDEQTLDSYKRYGFESNLTALKEAIRILKKESTPEKDLDYPQNLLSDLGIMIPYDEAKDHIDRVDYALSLLPTRDREIIYYRYREHLTLEEIGRKYSVTRERINQLLKKSLRTLRSREFCRLIISGQDTVNDHKRLTNELEEEREKLKEAIQSVRAIKQKVEEDQSLPTEPEFTASLTLDDIELSFCARRCLNRAGYHTVRDMEGMTEDNLMRIRNLGRKCAIEIMECLEEYGVHILRSDYGTGS